MYGSELWSLDCEAVESFCCTWRTALRRLLRLPFNSHCVFLSLLTSTLPVFDEICKRSVRFIMSCLCSSSNLVQSLARHGVVYAKYNSFIGRNALFSCNYFCWSVNDFILNNVNRSNAFLNSFLFGILQKKLQVYQRHCTNFY